jgi:hypothetical protein
MNQTYASFKNLGHGDTPHSWGRGLYKGQDCGPWTVFVLDAKGTKMNGGKSELYYEDKAAFTNRLAQHIVGLRIGSIVEGSDVEVGPVELTFPFTDEQLDAAVKEINDEASFYWKRDNTSNYKVCKAGQLVACVSWTEFESKPAWSEKVPAAVKKAFVKWINRPCPEGYRVVEYDKPVPFGPKGWTVEEFVDDCTY